MKRLGFVFALSGWLFVGGLWQPTAYASFGESLGRGWGYLFSPVNAVTNFVSDLGNCVLTSSAKFIQTVISNANPSNLVH